MLPISRSNIFNFSFKFQLISLKSEHGTLERYDAFMIFLRKIMSISYINNI